MPTDPQSPLQESHLTRQHVFELVWGSNITPGNKQAIVDAINAWHDRTRRIERCQYEYREALQNLSLWADDQEDANFKARAAHSGWLSKREHFTSEENRVARAMLYD